MKDMRTAIWLITAAGILAAAGISPAARPEAEPPRPIDEQLLDELGDDPIDELDRELSDPGDPPGDGPDDLRDRLRRELGAAAVAEDDNLLLKVTRSMRELEGRIARNEGQGGVSSPFHERPAVGNEQRQPEVKRLIEHEGMRLVTERGDDGQIILRPVQILRPVGPRERHR